MALVTRTPDVSRGMRDRPCRSGAGERWVGRAIVRRRMSAVRKADNRRPPKLPRFESRSRRDAQHRSGCCNRMMTAVFWSGRLQQYIDQAGMTIKPAKVLLISGVLGFCHLSDRGELSPGSFARRTCGSAAGPRPVLVIAFRRGRRLRKFEENFPKRSICSAALFAPAMPSPPAWNCLPGICPSRSPPNFAPPSRNRISAFPCAMSC